jgi:hypothetical protein
MLALKLQESLFLFLNDLTAIWAKIEIVKSIANKMVFDSNPLPFMIVTIYNSIDFSTISILKANK